LIKLGDRNGKLKHRQTKENGKGNKVETCWLRKRNKNLRDVNRRKKIKEKEKIMYYRKTPKCLT
jgi:hypothetical protein